MTMLRMSVNDAEWEEQLPGPGGTSRVAIGERGHRSSIWRAWANKSTSDVYVGVRNLTGVQKYSFHESGDWRFQWTTTDMARAFSESDSRIIDQWERPVEPEHGWTRCLNILVPHGHLATIPNDPNDKQVFYVPAPDEGRIAMISLLIASPDRGEVELRGMLPFDGFTLKSGQSALLLYGNRAMTENDDQVLDQIAVKVREHAASRPDVADLADLQPGARVGVFRPNDEGVRSVIDLSISALLARGQDPSA